MGKRSCWLVVPVLLLTLAACDAYFQSIGPGPNPKVESRDIRESRPSRQPAPAETIPGEASSGIRQALTIAVNKAAGRLGTVGGFLENPRIRIPLPERLQSGRTALESLGQEHLADQFVVSMNRAAESAAPEAGDVLVGAVRSMTIKDVMDVVKGPDDAATRYLESCCRARLVDRLTPVVSAAMAEADVTRYYRAFAGKAEVLAPFLGDLSLDVDRYVVDRTLEGFFTVMADYEKDIRENPAARTTELLRKVFGN